MQKKLLGMAVATALTAPAVALAQVQVYGTAHVSFNATKYGASSDNTTANPLGPYGAVSKMSVSSHAMPKVIAAVTRMTTM